MSTATISTDQNVIAGNHIPPVARDQQKRARTQLSCASCRHAKLRCDRNQPCSQCVKRNRASLCAYSIAPERRRHPQGIKGRLNHLESLVIGMMNDQSSSLASLPTSPATFSRSGNPATEELQVVTDQGLASHLVQSQSELSDAWTLSGGETVSNQVVQDINGTSYVGATHWAAILEDIEGVKAFLIEDPDEDSDLANETDTAAMALGNTSPKSRAELLATLPERAVVDRLVSRYFNSDDPTMIIIHKPTFQKEYQEFWLDPSTKPIMWVGLLYAILCLATFYCIRARDVLLEEALHSVHTYRTLCAQSLTLADYFKPGIYTMEALILYFASEFVQPGDSAAKCWVVHAMAVRLALRMGYHRDAKHHSNISVFHGEMRRRVWHLLVQVDLILSFQVGLPSMMRAIQSDTAPPRNIFDHDFSEDSVDLPLARPESELTPLSYMICKARICHAFGKIVEQANSILAPPYSDVLELDAHLRGTYDQIPPFLTIRSLDLSITDGPNLIMQRFNIVLLYHKSRCVLHRKYLTKNYSQSQYGYSRNSCIESALELLHYQSVINDAVQCGGPLSMHKWFLSTVAAHDFLLGAMIIYLNLINRSQSKGTSSQADNNLKSGINEAPMMFRKLEASYEIWKSSPREAKDAKKASRVLKIMLKNLKERLFQDDYADSASTDSLNYRKDELQFPQPQLGGLNNGDLNQVCPIPPGQIEDIGNMILVPDLLDWETWDGHINAPTQTEEQFWTTEMDFADFSFVDGTESSEK